MSPFKLALWILPIVLGCLIISSCSDNAQDVRSYSQEIEAWQEERNASMRDTSNSWLNLVGLHWLDKGESTFGSDSANTLRFPESAPAFAGTFIYTDTSLLLQVIDDVYIEHEGQAVQEIQMRHDMEANPVYLQMGSINFYAISRPEGIAIRVKDSQSPDLVAFEDIPNFTIDPNWKIEAKLEWYDAPKPLQVPTILGSERTQQSPALIVFEVDGAQYQLSPYKSYYGDPVWTVIFSDLTNDETTYGGGRFLSLDAPQAGTPSITLDFNKAYNPPCAFSIFATCPMPPPENRLAVAIPAGEQNYGENH